MPRIVGEKAAAKLPDCLILCTSICERTRVLKRGVAKIARLFTLNTAQSVPW